MENNEKSTLVQTVLRALDGYNQWDIDAIIAPRAAECTQQVLPYRLGRPVRNNAEYREYFAKTVIPYFKSFQVEILDIIEDQQNAKAAVSARSQGETVMGPYSNEYMLTFHLTKDHKEVLEIKEFVDSGYSDDYFKRLAEYVSKNHQAAS